MSSRRRSAFTLVELLVVITIIGILIALLLPAVQAAREAARRSQCTNNLKQIGLGLQMYHAAATSFPMGGILCGPSWLECILPFVEQMAAYETLIQGLPPTQGWYGQNYCGGAPNQNWANEGKIDVPGFNCPSSPLPTRQSLPTYVGVPNVDMQAVDYVGIGGENISLTNYPTILGNTQGNGVLPLQTTAMEPPVTMTKVMDGTSNTIAVSEDGNFLLDAAGNRQDWRLSVGHGGPWAGAMCWTWNNGGANTAYILFPVNTFSCTPTCRSLPSHGILATTNPLISAHPGGVLAVRVDGGTSFLSTTLDLQVLCKLANRADGLPVSAP